MNAPHNQLNKECSFAKYISRNILYRYRNSKVTCKTAIYKTAMKFPTGSVLDKNKTGKRDVT